MNLFREYHNECLICKNTNLELLIKYQKAYLVKCKKCNFIFSNKIPNNFEIDSCYNNYGRNDYLSEITIKRYCELLDSFEKYRKNSNLLDIGCGIGYFIEIAKQKGWNVYGTEYTDNAVNICKTKGIEMIKGSFTSNDYENEFFDIITSFEVIEHINNPNEFINHSNRILRKNGALFITTPNFNSLLRYYLKQNYNIIRYPEHLCYFDPKSINKLLVQNHYKQNYIKTTGLSLTRLKTSDGKPNHKIISQNSDDEKLRKSFEKNLFTKILKSAINNTLSFLGVGDTIKALYIKK